MPPGLNRRLSLIVDMSSKAALTGLKQLQSAVNAVSASAGRIGTGAATGLAALQKGASAATGAMQRLGQGIREHWMGASIAISAVSAAIGLFINKTAAAYMQMQSAIIGLKTIAKSYGVSGDAAEAAAKGLEASTNGFIDMGSAAQALKNLMGTGLSLDKAVALTKVLTEQAIFNRQTHYQLAEAVIVTTEGIRNNMSMAADATGTTKNLGIMQKEYAKSLGITTQELTQAQIGEAAYIGFMEQGVRSAGDLAKASGTAQGNQVLFAFAMKKAEQAIGEFSSTIKWGIANAITPYIQSIRMWIATHKELIQVKVAEWTKEIVAAITKVIDVGIEYGTMIVDWIVKNRDFILEVGKAAIAVGLLAVAISYLYNPTVAGIGAFVLLAAKSEIFRTTLEGLAKVVNQNRELLLALFGVMAVAQIVRGIRFIAAELVVLTAKMIAWAAAQAAARAAATGAELISIPGMATKMPSRLATEAMRASAALAPATGLPALITGLGTASAGAIAAVAAAGVAALAALYTMWQRSKDAMDKVRDEIIKPREEREVALSAYIAKLQALKEGSKVETAGLIPAGMQPATPTAAIAPTAALPTETKASQAGFGFLDVSKQVMAGTMKVKEAAPVYGPEEDTTRRRLVSREQELADAQRALQASQAGRYATVEQRRIQENLAQYSPDILRMRTSAEVIAPEVLPTQRPVVPGETEEQLKFIADKRAKYEDLMGKMRVSVGTETDQKLAAIDENYRQRIENDLQDLVEKNKKAGGKQIISAQEVKDFEIAASNERLQAIKDLTEGKIKDAQKVATTIMTLGKDELQAELDKIEEIRIARKKEVSDTIRDLESVAYGTSGKQQADAYLRVAQSLKALGLTGISESVGGLAEPQQGGSAAANELSIIEKRKNAMIASIDDQATKERLAATRSYGQKNRDEAMKQVEFEILTKLEGGKRGDAMIQANTARIANQQLSENEQRRANMLAGEQAYYKGEVDIFAARGAGHQALMQGMMSGFDTAMNVMAAMGNAFATGQKAQWRSLAAGALSSIAMIMRALAQQYAAMSVGALIGSATDPRNFAKAAQYGAQAIAASVGAGVLEGMASKQQDVAERMNQRENTQAQQGLNAATGGGGGNSASMPQRSEATSFASVSVQKEANITISPSVTIEAGHDVFIGEGSVEEFKVSLERVMVQSIKDAMSTGQIKVGRG